MVPLQVVTSAMKNKQGDGIEVTRGGGYLRWDGSTDFVRDCVSK